MSLRLLHVMNGNIEVKYLLTYLYGVNEID